VQKRNQKPALFFVALAAVAACSKADGSTTPHAAAPAASAPPAAGPAAPPARALSLVAEAGKRLFFDKTLSASGAMSCATCHDPAHAYGPPNARAVQLGGPQGLSPGVRAVPSIRYKEFTRGYSDLLDNPDGFSNPGPGGGLTWDGRADSLAEQARTPLLSPFEMANADAAAVIARLRASPAAAAFTKAFGAAALDDTDGAFSKVQLALQSFQLEDPSFHPYNSKYDLYLYKKPGGAFTAAEERGLKVFRDPKVGNCSGCHLSEASLDDGAPPQLTDFSFEAIGVPRNAEIPANRDRKFRDLGLCGPLRADHAPYPEYCAMFKTPSLRNVATRRAFFHNGVMHSLEQVIRFYNTRDTRPELWYPTVGGRAKAAPDPDFPRYGLVTAQYVGGAVQKFDDVPPANRKNVDKQMPLDGREAGSGPPMTEQQVGDLLCFLQTLTDDYRPGTPPASARCAN
jgi:cytochrome c peroxidase